MTRSIWTSHPVTPARSHGTSAADPSGRAREPVSVVVTVRNEAASIEPFLTSLLRQTRVPDEIVIADGGSTDGTRAVLDRLAAAEPRVRVLDAARTNISQGRNLAVRHARGPVVAVTDAGTEVASDWLESLTEPLDADPDVAVAAGFFLPGGETFMERCIAAVITPQLPEIVPERFLPSSRSVAFRKVWWEKVGGYPEWLQHCEDLVFDMDLKRAGATFAFAPGAVVTWRARPTLTAFARQYFLYARGDGHAHLWARRHLVRYGAYLAGPALLAAGRRHPAAYLALTAGAAAYLGKFYRRIARRPPAPGARQAAAAALVPVIVVTGDLAKMLGYPLGLLERWRAGSPERLGQLQDARRGRSAAVHETGP